MLIFELFEDKGLYVVVKFLLILFNARVSTLARTFLRKSFMALILVINKLEPKFTFIFLNSNWVLLVLLNCPIILSTSKGLLIAIIGSNSDFSVTVILL